VSEAPRKNSAVIELGGRLRATQVFLRMSAIELRRLAEENPDPDIAAELGYLAQQLQAEAEDLTPRNAE
jgi:hypothetical protein